MVPQSSPSQPQLAPPVCLSKGMLQKSHGSPSLEVQWLRLTLHFHCRGHRFKVQSLVGELISHMLCNSAKISKQINAHVCLVMADSLRPYGGICGPPGSLVHGILQTRLLEWVAIFFFRVSSWPRDWTHVFCVSCIAGRFFTTWAIREAQVNK